MLGVFFSPGEIFAELARHPGWIAPVLLYTLLSLAITYSFTERVGWERYLQRQMERNPRFAQQLEQVPAEQRSAMLQQQATISKWIGYGIGTISYAVMIVLVAGIMLLAMNVLGSTRLGYKTALAITAHAYMPWALAGLGGLAVIYLKDPSDVDIQDLLASHVGAFLPEETSPALRALAGSLDIFTFWTLFLLAVGFAAAAPKKLTTGKAFGIALVPWGIYVLGKVGLAAVFG
ncbi:MAG: YIP1 family protein [Firmicutes bacterium]|nr:YIP1 family protein [Bacillota bacterium]